MGNELFSDKEYKAWVKELKLRIKQSQLKAAVKVNAEMIDLYWSIGADIIEKQSIEGWGSKVIPQLSKDLRSEFPDVEGFSVTNFAAVVFFILGSALLILNNKNLLTGWGMVRPGYEVSPRSSFELTCTLIGNEHNLTAREIEILQFLAKGYSKFSICKELDISEGTVRTHAKRIYIKLDVHTQQEIINLIEYEMVDPEAEYLDTP